MISNIVETSLHLDEGQSRRSYSMQNLRLMKDIDSQWTYWWVEDRTDKLGQAFVVSSQQEWQLHYPEVGRCPQHAAGAGGGRGAIAGQGKQVFSLWATPSPSSTTTSSPPTRHTPHDTHIWAPHLDTQPTTLSWTPGEENFTSKLT